MTSRCLQWIVHSLGHLATITFCELTEITAKDNIFIPLTECGLCVAISFKYDASINYSDLSSHLI